LGEQQQLTQVVADTVGVVVQASFEAVEGRVAVKHLQVVIKVPHCDIA
jgi:hypothetical protein